MESYNQNHGERQMPNHNSRKAIRVIGHPNANKRGWVNLSVYLASKALGKPILKGVKVHHLNRDEFDDSPWNLVVCENAEYHGLLHRRTNKLFGKKKIKLTPLQNTMASQTA